MFRFILAVITGYLVFAVSAALLFQLTGQNPHGTTSLLFGTVSVVYGILWAVAAGWLAATIAPRKALAAGVAVGILIATGAAASLVLERHGRIWSQVSALLLMAPAAGAGGWIYRKPRATNTPD
jgi:hypothetical protein